MASLAMGWTALLVGCSSGGFDTREVALCGPDSLRGIIAQDFNGDGNDDLAVGCKTCSDPLTGRLEVWLSDASGTLGKLQSVQPGTFSSGGEGAGPITAADFNGDGIPDLLLDQGYQPGPKYHRAAQPFIFMGKPDGGYGQAIVLELPGSPGQKILADFNGDDKSDFLYSKITDDDKQGVVYLSQW